MSIFSIIDPPLQPASAISVNFRVKITTSAKKVRRIRVHKEAAEKFRKGPDADSAFKEILIRNRAVQYLFMIQCRKMFRRIQNSPNSGKKENIMKTLRLMVLFCSALGLVGVFSDVRPAAAHNSNQHTETATAANVVSGDASLENFVKHAAAHIGETTIFGELTQLVTDFRTDGSDWKSGSTYLILLTSPGGGVQSHANNRGLEDEDWSMLEDSRGNPVGQEFLSVGAAGDTIEYYNQTAKESYAIESIDPFFPTLKYVLIGGFDYEPDIQQVPYDQIPGADTIIPPVTAEDVSASVGDLDVAKEKLKMFVQGAIDFFSRNLLDPNVDLTSARKLFRAEDGPWRHVSTYIYIMDSDGNVIFNGTIKISSRQTCCKAKTRL